MSTIKKFFTVGCQPPLRKSSSTTKSRVLAKVTPTTRSSPTSDRASTSNVKAYDPFWNEACKENFEKFALVTKTGCVVSHSISCNGFSKKMDVKSSWIMKRMVPIETSSAKIYSPSSPYLPLEATVREVTLEKSEKKPKTSETTEQNVKRTPPGTRKIPLKGVLRSLKIRLRPTAEQRLVIRQWFTSARYAYNKTVEGGGVLVFDLEGRLDDVHALVVVERGGGREVTEAVRVPQRERREQREDEELELGGRHRVSVRIGDREEAVVSMRR